ncbi:hypothetical protein Airi01_032490 [Actinoallomurus iriomotensis]|uniref:Uncharacterized protein n=1 Tax=Actinoallomurus iriomotensis TaxID=478107 RepID=A0A9W6RJ37_9ACTN|nr:hypothetical protein Airi01_032490 [Actinoallomurus iriomotensis]
MAPCAASVPVAPFFELIGGISRKMLTSLGATLIDPIHTLTEWASANGDLVDPPGVLADRDPNGLRRGRA